MPPEHELAAELGISRSPTGRPPRPASTPARFRPRCRSARRARAPEEHARPYPAEITSTSGSSAGTNRCVAAARPGLELVGSRLEGA
ncbi:hypothetical protein QRY02_13685 [Amycolatopsis sp. DG1A-15b]|nr:hypothetical protein [Amycolatopsis sp. DG1A-15b]WIX93407.1 hypothetical protein QRY02_13685 [Amycolatopsis sp. DG1A-15b]